MNFVVDILFSDDEFDDCDGEIVLIDILREWVNIYEIKVSVVDDLLKRLKKIVNLNIFFFLCMLFKILRNIDL